MSSNSGPFEKWLHAATAGLERKVRQRLQLELSAHYEDAYDELVKSGLPTNEAAQRALESLGDADSSREFYREQYPAELPWERDFLPKKLAESGYGYVKGHKLIACSREELIEVCKSAGINGVEITLAWTPETDNVAPVETIPLLFQAIKEKRRRSARWELLQSAMWGVLLASEFRSVDRPNLRHVGLFFGLLTVLPAAAGFKHLRAANALTPEILAKEVAGEPLSYRLWVGFQSARLTLGLILACSIVTLSELFAIAWDGSFENAALVKESVRTGEWWRVLTCIFPHAGIQHLLFNVIGLGVFGDFVEMGIARMFLPIVFLVTAVSGSIFSFLFTPGVSVGASGGVLGLAGFLFAVARHPRAVAIPNIQQTVAYVACFTAVSGIIAFDLFDSAAHLGGLLAGLALGWNIKDPKKLSEKAGFKVAGLISCAILIAGALLALVLIAHPVPKAKQSKTPPAQATSPEPQTQTAAKRFVEGTPSQREAVEYWFPSRDPRTPQWCINLQPYHSVSLATPWLHPAYTLRLMSLPCGYQPFGGTDFDVRCLIQLGDSNAVKQFPQEVRGIRIGFAAERLHFLHATGGVVPDGTQIGKYLVHFANGAQTGIPIVYGQDVREWHARSDSESCVTGGEIAWSTNTCHETRLYHTIWRNQISTQLIESLDFVSEGTPCFPFLVALTIDPPKTMNPEKLCL